MTEGGNFAQRRRMSVLLALLTINEAANAKQIHTLFPFSWAPTTTRMILDELSLQVRGSLGSVEPLVQKNWDDFPYTWEILPAGKTFFEAHEREFPPIVSAPAPSKDLGGGVVKMNPDTLKIYGTFYLDTGDALVRLDQVIGISKAELGCTILLENGSQVESACPYSVVVDKFNKLLL